MNEKPAFIQGLYSYKGSGLANPGPPSPAAIYVVPSDKRAQTIYVRAGNAAAEMIYLVITSDGKPIRYFPLAAKGAMHVPLAVVEDLLPSSKLEVLVAAPEGIESSVVLDVGFLEIA